MNNSRFFHLQSKRCTEAALLLLLAIFAPSAFAQTNNPVPFIDAPVSPAVVASGSAGLTLTVNGAGFVSGSIVLWNGSPRATTFVTNAQLTVAIPASDITSVTTASLKVSNPAPGGGLSNVESVAVTAPIQTPNFAILPQTLSFYQVGQPIIGDFNTDGKPDIAFTEIPSIYGPFSVCISLGNGDGTFQSPSCAVPPAQAGDSSHNLGTPVIVDFNGDGKLDLAVPNVGDGFNNLSIFLGNGDGTLQAPTLVPAGGSPYSISAGDFNKDGRTDLAVVYRNNAFGILLGNGDGTFQAPAIVAVPIPAGITLGFGAVTTGDFNLDGNLDLILANLSSLSNDIYFVAGKGDG
ncbi:MAG TPA: VCBS repeat-containing protein, partial [Candidatus Acidoferrales bacterium]|nr:VCBS repeat-containing protein [Candidatus Acidoferrales bacterium]